VVLSPEDIKVLDECGGVGEVAVDKGFWSKDVLEVVRRRKQEAQILRKWDM